MPIRIHDETTVAAFLAVDEPTDVCGPGVRLLGTFIPDAEPIIVFPESGKRIDETKRSMNDPNAK